MDEVDCKRSLNQLTYVPCRPRVIHANQRIPNNSRPFASSSPLNHKIIIFVKPVVRGICLMLEMSITAEGQTSEEDTTKDGQEISNVHRHDSQHE